MSARLSDEARSALHEGRQAYIAIEASSGPHVTPELYAYSGDRLWFASAVTTLKAKVLQRTGSCAVAVPVPGRCVLLEGPVESFDLRHPTSLLRSATRAPAAARALLGYGVRNAPDLLAFGADLGRGRLGRRLPPLRTLFALEPVSGALVERDTVTESWGSWAAAPVPAAAGERPGGIPVVAAVAGPVALPGSWFPDDGELHLVSGLAARLPIGSAFPISLVGDEYSAPGPDAKKGLLLRGIAHRAGDASTLSLELDRLVEWDGVATSTSHLDPTGR